MSPAEPHLDLAHLRALCDEATPGPWRYVSECLPEVWDANDRTVLCDLRDVDARYLAAVSPDVVRALLDRLERAEADLDETRFCLGVAASRDPGLIQAIREAPRD